MLRTFVHLWNSNKVFFHPPIDSNTTDTFKAQKGSKDIVKIVHVTSVVPPSERLLHQQHRTDVSWYSRERTSKTDTEEKKSFFLFAHKQYSCSFMKLRLNHWYHMNYLNDVLTTFLGLERGICVCCLCRVRKLLDFIKTILICVTKRNEGLTGLEQHEGETWIFIFE